MSTSSGEKKSASPKIVISEPHIDLPPPEATRRYQRRSFSLVEKPPPIDTSALPRASSTNSPLIQTSIVPSPGKRGRALTLGHISLPSAASTSTATEQGMEDLAVIDAESIKEGTATSPKQGDPFFPDLSFDEGKTLNSTPDTLIVVEDNVEPGLTVGFFKNLSNEGDLTSLSAAATAAATQLPTPRTMSINTGGKRSGGGHARKDSLPAPLTPSPPMEIPLSASRKSFQQALDDAKSSISSADTRVSMPIKPESVQQRQLQRASSPAAQSLPSYQSFKVSGGARPFSSIGLGGGGGSGGGGKNGRGKRLSEEQITTRSLFFELLPYCMIYCGVYLLCVVVIAVFVILFLRAQVVVDNVRFETPSKVLLTSSGLVRAESLLNFALVNRYPWAIDVQLEANLLSGRSDAIKVNRTRLESKQRKNMTIPFTFIGTQKDYQEMSPPGCLSRKLEWQWKIRRMLLFGGALDFVYTVSSPTICLSTGRPEGNNTLQRLS